MTRDEAIWRLKDHFRVHDDGRPTPYLDEAVRMAIEALQEPKWIPCSERLPDRNGTYLLTVSSYDKIASIEFMIVDRGNSNGTFLHYSNKKHANAKTGKVVIAWMPLPEPYKAGEQE